MRGEYLVGELSERRVGQLGLERRQALVELLACSQHRHAVDIGLHRGGRRARVADLVGGGLEDVHLLDIDAEGVGGHLRHLGVQALAHLDATVRDRHRAIGVDVHQRAGLVQEAERERHAELGRNERDAALLPSVLRVELSNLLLALVELRRLAELRVELAHVRALLEPLLVVREIAIRVHVEFLSNSNEDDKDEREEDKDEREDDKDEREEEIYEER